MSEFINCAGCPVLAGESETMCAKLIINELCSIYLYRDIPGSGPQFIKRIATENQHAPLNPLSEKPVEVVLPDEKYL